MPTTPMLVVIADDLTGAADTGVQLARAGVSTVVALAAGVPPDSALLDSDVLVTTTYTRHLDPKSAYERVTGVAAWARDSGAAHVYLKVDSTLRGNVATEIEAVLRVSGRTSIALVPAYPAMGRTVRDGYVYVNGVPLEQTAFARDPLEPSVSGDIRSVLGSRTHLPIAVVAQAQLPALRPPTGIVAVDVESDDDLPATADWLQRHDLLHAVAGSAGLAAHLPDRLGLPRRETQRFQYPERVLIVCGSLHEASLRQCARAHASGTPEVRIPVQTLLGQDDIGETGMKIAAEVQLAVARATEVILRPDVDRQSLEMYVRNRTRDTADRRSLFERAAGRLARVVRQVTEASPFDALIVFGGDTLAAIARELGWRGLRPIAEVLPGVPVSSVIGGTPPLVISKAGGFGTGDLLARVRERLHASQP